MSELKDMLIRFIAGTVVVSAIVVAGAIVITVFDMAASFVTGAWNSTPILGSGAFSFLQSIFIAAFFVFVVYGTYCLGEEVISDFFGKKS